MRSLSAAAVALAAGALFAGPPAAAAVSTGGAGGGPPSASSPSTVGGGAAYRRTARRPRRAAPLLSSFRLRRSRLFLHGHPAEVSFRIETRARLRDVRIVVVPRGRRSAASTIRLGGRRSGLVRLTARESGTLAQGDYRVGIRARDARGRRLRRRAGVPSGLDLSVLHHRFPLAGTFTYGGADARFGAPRGEHDHRGQDLVAAEGTPVLAPRGGIVEAVQYQAGGAGHYAVVDGADEDRDYVFMHLRSGSIRVREGQTVRTGQRIGEVGSTGRSSGPHLHFEVWTGSGWFSGGRPVDPLPLLRAWEPSG